MTKKARILNTLEKHVELKSRIAEHFSNLKSRTRLSEIGKHEFDIHGNIDKKRWTLHIQDIEKDDFVKV